MNINSYELLNKVISKLMILSFSLVAISMLWIKNPVFNNITSKTFLIIIIIWILIPLVRALIMLTPEAIKSIKIKSWRIIISTRRYYKLTKINNFLLHVGASMFLISMVFYGVLDFKSPFLSYITTVILCMSFLLDIFHRMKFIYTKIWKGVLGKVFLALYAALAFTITNFLARNWVMHTTNLDAKYFSEVVNSVSVLFTPLSYVIITSILCLIIIIPECLWLMLLAAISPLKENIKKIKFEKPYNLLVRMQTGKRLEILKPKEIALLKSKAVLFRILPAPLLFAGIAFTLIQINNFSGKTLDKIGREWLVINYYHSKTENPKDTFRYYEISDSKYSMAYVLNGEWYFTTYKTEK